MKTYILYKAIRRVIARIKFRWDYLHCKLMFWGNNIACESFNTRGVPYVSVAIGGKCTIGKNLFMNNGISTNPIGVANRCTIFVDKNAELTIGDNLGISQSALICHTSIKIGNHVNIGGGVCIYDTDFHSLDPQVRVNPISDNANKVKMPVIIEDHVFIGAHSLILKGVTIGENSIIGAGSVLTKSVPANQIWAGNPAKFIRQI
jgi:acetyltransferase-like isoleucine patch superfamily enzyme